MGKIIYMDHSATTPVDPQVLAAMIPFYQQRFGNPSSIHSVGRDACKGMDEAREKIASFINAAADEIIFCSGGTEANNHAIISYAETNRKRGNHIITSAIEHHAVLDTCHHLESRCLTRPPGPGRYRYTRPLPIISMEWIMPPGCLPCKNSAIYIPGL